MKKIFLVLTILCSCSSSDAQNFIFFKLIRYDENYTRLKNDSVGTVYKRTKYQPLSCKGNAYVSFGGDIRYQYFNIKNEEWGSTISDKDGFIFSRFILHADFHTGDYIRTFVQLQSSLVDGKAITSPVDQDPLELHQGFIDFNLMPYKKSSLLFRIGRQELSYGSQRLIAVREGPNNRESFDGVKVVFSNGDCQADAFFSHFVQAQKGLFDDGFNKNNKFWGAYTVRKNIPIIQNIDLYYLGIWNRKTIFDDGAASELRHTIGSRIWSSKTKVRYDIEGVYQFGKFGEKDISAWALASNAGYKFTKILLRPEVGLKSELMSGDAHYGDNKQESFNPLFPMLSYYGYPALFAPSNLFDIHPSLTFELIKTLSLDIDYDLFWRYSLNDGIYGPNMILIYSGKNNPDRFVGKQLETFLAYTPNNFLYLRGVVAWFNAGDFLKAAGPGKDILYSEITMQLTF